MASCVVGRACRGPSPCERSRPALLDIVPLAVSVDLDVVSRPSVPDDLFRQADLRVGFVGATSKVCRASAADGLRLARRSSERARLADPIVTGLERQGLGFKPPRLLTKGLQMQAFPFKGRRAGVSRFNFSSNSRAGRLPAASRH